METSSQAAVEVASTPKRQQRSIKQKREIVEETLVGDLAQINPSRSAAARHQGNLIP
jgi:hypothetical protein